MNLNRNQSTNGEGTLPPVAPLANPYVPFQPEQPEKYDARKGIIRGTLFPGLDLPFMGMVNKNELPRTQTSELQALAFAIQELSLYLDTHQDDLEALELYQSFQEKYQLYRNEYEKTCNPLNHMSINTGEYKWLNGPWPWEYARNQEV